VPVVFVLRQRWQLRGLDVDVELAEAASLIAVIGIILLIGIVKKNAIMMIDFALDAQRTRGMDPAHAIREACILRFRPIMMTTLAALMGALPIALGLGAGAGVGAGLLYRAPAEELA